MKTSRRDQLVRHLSEAKLDQAIKATQKADETGLIRRLCFVKNLYQGDTCDALDGVKACYPE